MPAFVLVLFLRAKRPLGDRQRGSTSWTVRNSQNAQCPRPPPFCQTGGAVNDARAALATVQARLLPLGSLSLPFIQRNIVRPLRTPACSVPSRSSPRCGGVTWASAWLRLRACHKRSRSTGCTHTSSRGSFEGSAPCAAVVSCSSSSVAHPPHRGCLGMRGEC